MPHITKGREQPLNLQVTLIKLGGITEKKIKTHRYDINKFIPLTVLDIYSTAGDYKEAFCEHYSVHKEGKPEKHTLLIGQLFL